MCDFLYHDPFLTDPLVTSYTAHKNISLLRAFQDVCVTAGIVQFYAAWMKYLVALLWHPWGKMFPERWICCPSLLLSADTPKHKYPVGRCLLVELSPRGLGMPKNENAKPTVTMVLRDLRSELGSSCLRLSRGSSWILLFWLQDLLWTFACWIAFVTLPSLIPCQHLLRTLPGNYVQPKVFLDLLYQPCARDEFPCSREILHPISSALLCRDTKWINRL